MNFEQLPFNGPPMPEVEQAWQDLMQREPRNTLLKGSKGSKRSDLDQYRFIA
jgi:hypothetical protein